MRMQTSFGRLPLSARMHKPQCGTCIIYDTMVHPIEVGVLSVFCAEVCYAVRLHVHIPKGPTLDCVPGWVPGGRHRARTTCILCYIALLSRLEAQV